jgi:hypothetical protein
VDPVEPRTAALVRLIGFHQTPPSPRTRVI